MESTSTPIAETDTRFDLNRATQLLLDIAHEKSVESLLQRLVNSFSSRPHVACVQIWLIDLCDKKPGCNMGAGCQGQTRCLHLVAGRGTSITGGPAPYFGDTNSRVALGEGLIGRCAADGKQYIVRDAEEIAREAAHGLDWAEKEQIRLFGGTPIIYKGETLGVMVGYSRGDMPDESRPWGRIFADHVGSAIANARAFEQIQHLKAQLEMQNSYLQEEVVEAKAFGSLVGQSESLRQVISQIDLVAPTEASVLVLGETGTGKELVAHEIHRRSKRASGPLVRVNCASIPRELFESEFFGHVKGSFTGAVKDRAGRFETAHGGTIFLDEIGEVPLDMQGKLLRVLQEKKYERVGEDRTRTADVRVIGATNRDLKKEVAAGRFREDLFYRLHVFPIQVAPLRERIDDIPLLAQHFVDLSVRELKCPSPRLTRAGVARLQNYNWPGNVRELRNVIERSVILARGGTLEFVLPTGSPPPATPQRHSVAALAGEDPGYLTEAELQRRERDNLLTVLRKANWKIKGPGGAAELLGVKATTLLSRMQKWGIQKPG